MAQINLKTIMQGDFVDLTKPIKMAESKPNTNKHSDSDSKDTELLVESVSDSSEDKQQMH